jgi:hypothetical protein
MRRLVSAGLVKTLVLSAGAAATFGLSAALAPGASADTTPATNPPIDIVGIENQLAFLVQEVVNIGSNNLVQCVLSGFTSPACGHNPV